MKPKQSREPIKAAWDPTDRFEILRKRFDDALIYTAFAESSISVSNALNLLLNVILKTGIFQVQYKEWHNLPVGERNLVNALVW